MRFFLVLAMDAISPFSLIAHTELGDRLGITVVVASILIAFSGLVSKNSKKIGLENRWSTSLFVFTLVWGLWFAHTILVIPEKYQLSDTNAKIARAVFVFLGLCPLTRVGYETIAKSFWIRYILCFSIIMSLLLPYPETNTTFEYVIHFTAFIGVFFPLVNAHARADTTRFGFTYAITTSAWTLIVDIETLSVAIIPIIFFGYYSFKFRNNVLDPPLSIMMSPSTMTTTTTSSTTMTSASTPHTKTASPQPRPPTPPSKPTTTKPTTIKPPTIKTTTSKPKSKPNQEQERRPRITTGPIDAFSYILNKDPVPVPVPETETETIHEDRDHDDDDVEAGRLQSRGEILSRQQDVVAAVRDDTSRFDWDD